jgi:hypothetical protein
MVVAIIALVVAASGTAVAAKKLVSGDTLIVKGSLSGNRLVSHTLTPAQIRKGSLTAALLKKHTLTGNQVNLARLGKVPSASNADHATAATSASSALNANNASNAAELNGLPGSSYLTSANRVGAGRIVTASATGAPTTVFTSGPFTLTMTCTDTGSGPALQLFGTSTIGSSAIDGQVVAASSPVDIDKGALDVSASNAPTANPAGAIDFEAPNGASAIVTGADGINSLGSDCWADFAGIR